MKKPVVLISQCIEHDHCRYDGSQISSPFVDNLKAYVDFITVCPEVGISLPIPREAIRIVEDGDGEKLVYSLTGTDVTEKMIHFSQSYIASLEGKKIHGFILKSRSPSCGIKDVKIYRTFGKAPSLGRKTTGFFGKTVIANYPHMAIEDEGRLTNYNIRDHFLTRIYTMASFDEVINAQSIKALIDFHSKNKYLLMAYHQFNQKKLGRIVANHEKESIKDVTDKYYQVLLEVLAKPLRRGTNMNMLMHLLGYFKKVLSKEEKAYFLDMLEQYSQKKVPFSVPIAIIHSWVIRFEEPYLTDQSIFEPYPRDILEVTDSGKGI